MRLPVRALLSAVAALVFLLVLTLSGFGAAARAAPTRVADRGHGLGRRLQVQANPVPFSGHSPWLTPLPDDAPLDPRSAAINANIVSQIHEAYGHAALNTWQYSAPIYTVPHDEPSVDVEWSNCEHLGSEEPAFAAALTRVPIPRDAIPSMGADGEMVVWQPSTDTEWEFFKASRAHGRWFACWGGRIQNVSRSQGVFTDNTGATASGLPLLGFLIRVSDLRSGSIDHAINLEVPDARRSVFSWPAQRTDGWRSGPTYPAEGERFRLPASLDLDRLHLSPGQLMIARAMQHYGLIVTDQSGAVSMQAEDPRPFELHGAADPYAPYFSGPQYSWLEGIPWQDLQALAWNYGETGGVRAAQRPDVGHLSVLAGPLSQATSRSFDIRP